MEPVARAVEASILHKDPVCGMTVDQLTAPSHVVYQGTDFYFCCEGCAVRFRTDPEAFPRTPPTAAPPPAVPAPASTASMSGASYTCPMHPEILLSCAGTCPICGMPLESILPIAGDDGNQETKEIFRRLLFCAALALPIAVLSMTHMSGGHHGELLPSNATAAGATDGATTLVNYWTQLVLSTPVVLFAAKPFFERGASSIKNRSLNMFTLLSLGIGLPYIYSLVSLTWATMHGQPSSGLHVYFESAVVITALAWVGQFLEARARVQSSSAIRDLISLMPTEATVILHDGTELIVPVKDISIDARVRVQPGERIAVDGVTLDGTSSVNESMLTGEAMPVSKQVGSLVSAGSINGTGSLIVQAKRVGGSTILSQMVSMVSQAQRSRIPVQQLADRVSAIFVPLVILIALVTVAGWSLSARDVAGGLSAALAVLVVACPCALGLATPMSIIVATGRAAKAGVLFKEVRSLQLLADVDTIVIDKTGTLTTGMPRLIKTHLLGDLSEDQLLALASSVESKSEHPLGSAVVAASNHLAVPECQNFSSKPGAGITGVVNGLTVSIGTPAYLLKIGANCAVAESLPPTQTALTSVFVAIGAKCEARLDFADELREGAAEAVMALTQKGLDVIMATGDNLATAENIATAVGITRYYARLLPTDKSSLIKMLQESGAKVAMAGDGVNDALSLVQADVGISMGSGTDVAVHSADIVLMNSDLKGILRAQKVSQAMLTNVKENLWLAFAYNLVAIPIATGLFGGVIGFSLDPMLAAGAMSMSSVAVIANALRLRGLKL